MVRVKRSWVDLSVLDEMALRLRNAGLWDNNLGDGIVFLKARIRMLERFSQYERWASGKIKRPLKSWEDCRRLLTVITSSRTVTFTDIPAPVEACLTLAVLLEKWQKQDKPIPSDIRGMMHGAIAVEWGTGNSIIIDGKGIHGA